MIIIVIHLWNLSWLLFIFVWKLWSTKRNTVHNYDTRTISYELYQQTQLLVIHGVYYVVPRNSSTICNVCIAKLQTLLTKINKLITISLWYWRAQCSTVQQDSIVSSECLVSWNSSVDTMFVSQSYRHFWWKLVSSMVHDNNELKWSTNK